MKLARPTIVLFDMDGTTVRHVNPRMLGWLEKLDDAAYKMGRLFHKKEFSEFDEQQNPQPKLMVHRMIHRFRRKPVEQIVQPCPGIYNLLNLLHAAQIPTGIVSNGLGKGYGYEILTKFHLEQYFQARTFREHITHSKPHPEPILRGLARFKREIKESDVVWYIGDRHKDITAALAADKISPATIMPFSYGIHAAVAVLEKGLGPDHIIMTYPDFTAKIKTLIESA